MTRAALVLLLLCWAGAARADDEAPNPEPSYLSPAGVLAADRHAFFVSGDTELPGYPAVELGWRYGIAGVADVGLEVQAIDVAILGRVHGKVAIYESDDRKGFLGFRMRVDFKRQKQAVSPEVFRDIDDYGFVVAPEYSAGIRFGEAREHTIYFFTYAYLDFDIRPEEPLFEWFFAPALWGYEWHHSSGFHLLADAGIGWEVGNPLTAGEIVPRMRLSLGWEL